MATGSTAVLAFAIRAFCAIAPRAAARPDGSFSRLSAGWEPWPDEGAHDEWSNFYDEAEPLLCQLWKEQHPTAEPWTRAVITYRPDGSIEPEFGQSETIVYDERAATARKVRENTFSGYGDLDADMIAPEFGGAFGLPSWPCRPGWRVLRRDYSRLQRSRL